MIRLSLPTKPVAKGRPRFTRNGHTYTPKKTREATEALQWLMKEEWNAPPISDPTVVAFRFYMPIPKSWSKKERSYMIGRPHVKKPDLDNLIKLVKDAGNGILWEDDSLIWAYEKSFKVYSEHPRIELYVDVSIGTN